MTATGFASPSANPAGGAVVEVVDETAPGHRSYVDWPAILAGAFVAFSLALVLNAFGAGLGLTMAGDPWDDGLSAVWFFAAAALWYIWVQISSVMAGGYLAGRMRRRLFDASEHESDVRDGAHGLVVWAVGTVVGAALLLGAAAAGVNIAGKLAGGATTLAGAPAGNAGLEYVVGRLFRPADTEAVRPDTVPADADGSDIVPVPATPEAADIARRDVVHILRKALPAGDLPDADRAYVARLVADTTGLTAEAAQARVDGYLNDVLTELRDTAEAARKTGIVIAFVTAATLLVSGIAGWWAAGLGGRHRDEGTDLTWWMRIR